MAVAHTVNAVQSPHDEACTGRLAAADALARALTLDMANWWQPTAENYFARIKKEQILQAIQEATGAPVKERLRSLKKKDLAAEAEKSVTGTHWLPELLRGPGAKNAKKYKFSRSLRTRYFGWVSDFHRRTVHNRIRWIDNHSVVCRETG